MSGDYYLVFGIVVGVLAVPPLLGAYSEGRPPRAAAIMVLIAISLIALALQNNPKGYKLNEVQQVFARVIGSFVN